MSLPPTFLTRNYGRLTSDPGDNKMECIICKQGTTHPGVVTVTLNRDESTIIVKRVPAEICENCGEYYLSEAVTAKLLERAAKALENGAEVEITRFAA
jgi:YgiT-type zinc finger domain-containing protein